MGIIGKPFLSFINEQVERRQEALGEGLLGNDLIKLKTQEAFMTSTPFIRLASSVSISPDLPTTDDSDKPVGKSVAQQIRENGLFDNTPESEWVNNGLSQKCILNGVPTSYSLDSEGNYTEQTIAGALNVSGNDSGTNPSQFTAAYGWGYNKNGILHGRGYVPPPGITSVDFEYKNDGALAIANVNIKAFSPEQFAIIDILYMRPGFTVLLEFGHTTYLDNKGKIKYLDTSSTYPFDYLFNNADNSKFPTNPPTYSKMAKLIRKEKKDKEGNYEGFFGRITKFNWKFNADGSYDISVKLTGTGDVINSLNVNLPKLSDSSISISGKDGGIKNTVEFAGGFDSLFKERTKKTALEEGGFIISDAFESQLNFELYNIFNDEVSFSEDEKHQPSDISIFDVPILGKKYTREFRAGVLKYDVRDGYFGKEYSPLTLIKLGALLSMIQKICNVTDGKDNSLIQFEMVRNIFSKAIKEKDDNPLYVDNTGDFIKEDETYMTTFPGNISSDPNICFKQYGELDGNIVGEEGKKSHNPKWAVNGIISPSHSKVDGNNKLINPSLAYRLSNVWVNVNFVTTLLKDLRQKDKDETQIVPLLDLVQGILTGINESCGGINNFRVIFDEESAEIKIISESPALSNKTEKFTTLNTYGFDKSSAGVSYGSFVTSLDLNSELSDKMATQITIGAAANNNDLNGDGAIFSNYSRGLKDTLFVDKKSYLEELTGAEPLTESQKISKIMTEGKYGEALEEIYGKRKFAEDSYVSTLKQINSSIAPKIMNQYFNKGYTPSTSFLPFNMSLTMHGLGGVRIYDAFKIDGKVLPLSYNPKDIKLIIKSLSHTVSLEGWKTIISTISMPDFDYKEIPSDTTPPYEAGETTSSSSTTRVSSNSNQNLKELIGVLESGNNYNKVVGGKIDPELTKRTALQNRAIYGNQALGRYQIQYNTWFDMTKNGNMIFSSQNQDKVYQKLLLRRGLNQYKADKNAERFAFNLSKEWAALPSSAANVSYYDKVGNNKSRTSWDDVINAIKFTYG